MYFRQLIGVTFTRLLLTLDKRIGTFESPLLHPALEIG